MKNKGIIIAITSGKGGVGKSIFATNLAGVFASLKMKVLLIDMDLFSGGISVMLNLPKNKTIYNMADDIVNNRFKDADSYLCQYNEFIDVLPACKDPREGNKIDSNTLEQIISIYKNHYDIVLIDTNHLPISSTLIPLEMAQEILFLISDNPVDLKNSSNLLNILKNANKNVKVILNNSFKQEKNYFSTFDIKSVIGCGIDYFLPSSMYITNINKYLMDGKILVLNDKLSFKSEKDRQLLLKIAKDMGETNEE